VINNLVLFEYQVGRNKEVPAKMLKNFKGFLQTDGYAAYDQFGQREGIQMLHCMAHARRYFKEAEVNMLCWPSRPSMNRNESRGIFPSSSDKKSARK